MRALIATLTLIISLNSVFGQFGSGQDIIYTTGRVENIKSFDLDNDGDLDILTTARWGTVCIHENDGNGNFGEKIVITTGHQGTNVHAGDLDSDGDLDIIVSSTQFDNIGWCENLGNLDFDSFEFIETVNNPTSLGAADLDNDNDIDLLFTSMTNDAVYWKENLGNAIYGTTQIISLNANSASDVDTLDIDKDGDIDIVSTSRNDNKLAWYENLGGSFGPENIVSTNIFGANDVHVSDLDNDGDLDVVVSALNGSRYSWFENIADTLNSSENIINSNIYFPYAVNTVDADNDGDLDIIAGSDHFLAWFENLGGGNIDTARNIIKNGGAVSIYVDDLDNDGHDDVLSAHATNNHEADNFGWQKNLVGSFGPYVGLFNEFPNEPVCIEFADIDHDGDQDFVVASNLDDKIGWIENHSNGSFSTYHNVSSNVLSVKDVETTDIDNDGDLDILTVSRLNPFVIWFENLGNGTFDTIGNIISNNSYDFVHATDVNNDGNIDVISASYYNDEISWFENLGGGIFNSTANLITNSADGASSIFAADLNNDGFNDIISSSSISENIEWYENLGGTYGPPQLLKNNINDASVVSASDFDLDGDIDVVYGGDPNGLDWIENLGAGSFNSSPYNIGPGFHPMSLQCADIDGDGDNDIISGGDNGLAPGTLVVFENCDSGIFCYNPIFEPLIQVGISYVIGTDYDNDGDLDIIGASSRENSIMWYENFSIHKFKLKGTTFYDANQNQIFDTTELGLTNAIITSQPNALYSFTDSLGNYQLYGDSGVFTVNYQIDSWWDLTTDSSTYTRMLTGINPVIDSLNFGFYPDSIFTSIKPSLTGSFPRCNDTINYWVNIQNQGTTLPDGIIHLQLDDSITYISATITPDSIVNQNIYWSYDSLFFFSSELINLQVQLPDFNSMGDTLASFLTVNQLDSLGSGSIIYSSIDTLEQILVCAYDPNDKNAEPEGIGPEGYIANNQELEYLIRFQNTGNDTAITVMIRDQLDSNLNWGSMQPIASSHAMQSWIEQDGEAVFRFNNIMLPDSNVDFMGSQGFVKFRIRPKTGLLPNTPIFNTAHIYFDLNPAVITNTVLNTIDTINATVSIKKIAFTEHSEVIVFPNPFQDNLTIYYKGIIDKSFQLILYDVNGKEVFRKENVTNNKTNLNLNQLTNGLYIVVGTDDSGEQLFRERIIAQ